MRDKLVELLTTTLTNGNDKVVILRKAAEDITEYLIANGVTISVRCKDCKHWNIRTGNDPSLKYFCNVDGMWCKPARSADDYCSYGERKDNGNRTEL